MRFFVRTRKFKMLVGIFAILIAVTVVFAMIGGAMAPGSSIGSALITPFQRLFTTVSHGIGDTWKAFTDNQAIMEENAALQQQVDELTGQLTEYQTAINENAFYKGFLEIKETHPDFQFAEAMVIAADGTDLYHSFVIDKGSLAGVSAHDPVITSAGLLGYVSEVSLTSAKVTTLLDPGLNVGGYDSRTGDTGVLTGDAAYAAGGYTRLYNLPRSSSVAIDDYILTSGGGIFPKGLVIGQVADVSRDTEDTTVSASIRPMADYSDLRKVMVITYFDGQGSVAQEGGAAK